MASQRRLRLSVFHGLRLFLCQAQRRQPRIQLGTGKVNRTWGFTGALLPASLHSLWQ